MRRPRSAAELTTALRPALDETERLVQLTENLLRLACTDNAHSPQPGTSTPLAPLIADAADRFRNTATAAGRQVIVDELPAEPAAAVDRDPLDRMVDGLLDNALRHGQGSVRLQAFPTSGPHGPEHVEIHVLDDGPGFPRSSCPVPSSGSLSPMPRAADLPAAWACDRRPCLLRIPKRQHKLYCLRCADM